MVSDYEMNNMDKFNNLLDGIDMVYHEKLIMEVHLHCQYFVENSFLFSILQRSDDGIYNLRDGLQPRDRNVVSRYTPFFTKREVTRKKNQFEGWLATKRSKCCKQIYPIFYKEKKLNGDR
jgi:hypothetical protein